MNIQINISPDDIKRAANVPLEPSLLAGAFMSVIQTVDEYEKEYVIPVLDSQLNMSDREGALYGLHYRCLAYARTAVALNSVAHFQSLASAARSTIEIYLDMELLHQNKVTDGMGKLMAHMQHQRLKAAHRMVEFAANNPLIVTDPTAAAAQKAFITTQEAAINAQCVKLFGVKPSGAPNVPQHWSGLDMLARGKLLGSNVEALVTLQYDLRNFHVHSGLTGVAGFNKNGFEIVCFLSLKAISEVLVGQLKILGKEFFLYKVVEDFWDNVKKLEDFHAFTATDKRLIALGDAPHITVFVSKLPVT